MMKKGSPIVLLVLFIGGGVGWLTWYIANQPKTPESEIVSRKGIHWHPELKIIVKGEKVAIPANIGIGMQYAGHPQYDPMMHMTDVHTHDVSGTLHWEVMEGPVKKEDVRLGNFFAIWGKKFDGTPKMFVNGKANAEFHGYLIKDKDIIEIRYE